MRKRLFERVEEAVNTIVQQEVGEMKQALLDLLKDEGFTVVKTDPHLEDGTIEYIVEDPDDGDSISITQQTEDYGDAGDWYAEVYVDNEWDSPFPGFVSWERFAPALLKCVQEIMVPCPECEGEGYIFDEDNEDDDEPCPLCEEEGKTQRKDR